MKPEIIETAKNNSDCEIRLGQSSWDSTCKSVKYTWFDKSGKATRGGEFPVEALPQILRMAIEYNYLSPADIFNG